MQAIAQRRHQGKRLSNARREGEVPSRSVRVPSITKRSGHTEKVAHLCTVAGHHATGWTRFCKYRNGNHQRTIGSGVRADITTNHWALKCECGSAQSVCQRAHLMIRHGGRKRHRCHGTRRNPGHSRNIADIARERLACHQAHGCSKSKVSTGDHLVCGNQHAPTVEFHQRHVIAWRHQHLGSAARRKFCIVLTNFSDEL